MADDADPIHRGRPTEGALDDLAIVDAPDAGRYEARLGDRVVGWVDYRRLRRRIAAIHTEVVPGFEGRGIAGRLIRRVIDDARAAGIGVTPVCPLFVAHFARHPEDADLVRTGRERPEF